MTDGQKVNIPLDSPLDTSSSDMLVSVQSPTFLHNRQQYQGKYLPSSVRYEHDGWAVDWDVYDFKVSNTPYTIKSDDGTELSVRAFKKNIDNTRRIQLLNPDTFEVIGSFIYNRSNNVIINGGIVNSVKNNENNIILNCTYNSVNFNIYINRVTSAISTDNSRFTATITSDSYSATNITVQDTTSTIHVSAALLYSPTSLQSAAVSLPFITFERDWHTWQLDDNVIQYNQKRSTATAKLGSKFATVTKAELSNEKLSLDFNTSYDIINAPTISTEAIYPYISGMSAPTDSAIGSGGQKTFDKVENTLTCASNTGTALNDTVLYKNSDSDYSVLTLSQQVPVWAGLNITELYHTDTTGASAMTSGTVATSATYTGLKLNFTSDANATLYNKQVNFSSFVVWEHCRSTKNSAAVAARYSCSDFGMWCTVTVKYIEAHAYDNSHYKDNGNTWVEDKGWAWNTDKTEEEITVSTLAIIKPPAEGEITGQIPSANFSIDAADVISETAESGKIQKDSIEITGVSYIYVGEHNIVGSSSAWFSNLKISVTVDSSKKVTDWTVEPTTSYSMLYNFISADQSADKLKNVYACCFKGIVQSAITQAPGVEITENAYNSKYTVTDGYGSTPTGCIRLDSAGDNLFKCTLQSVSLSPEEAAITTVISAVNSGTYLFYYSPAGTSSDVPSRFTPYCYVTGVLSNATNNALNLAGIIVNKTYTQSSTTGNVLTRLTGVATDGNKYSAITVFSSNISRDNILANGWLDTNGSLFDDITVSIGDFSFEYYPEDSTVSALQTITLTIGEHIVYLLYTLLADNDDCILRNPPSLTIDNKDVSVSVTYTKLSDLQVKFNTTLQYSFVAQLAICLDKSMNYTVTDATPTNITFLAERYGKSIVFNMSNNVVTIGSYQVPSVTVIPTDTDLGGRVYGIVFTSEDYAFVTLTASKLFNISDAITAQSYILSKISFKHNNKTFAINVATVETLKSILEANYTDIRDVNMLEHSVANIDAALEYTFVRQQWDTNVSTEKFWWINESNILVLTNTELILRTKSEELDDWYGDRWTDTKTINRFDIISTSVIKYICSNSFNGSATKFITFKQSSSGIAISIYNPLDLEATPTVITIPLQKVALGNKLNSSNTSMFTYNDIPLANFLSAIEVSATSIDNRLIIGIHWDKNFNQWAVIVKGTTYKILHGYGYVGVNGTLTGGEIPSKYFDTKIGFNGTVQPLSILSSEQIYVTDIAELNTIEDKIVGNDSQQWYISSKIDKIVSHLEYDTTTHAFIIKTLPLTNNYVANYASPSYGRATFSRWSFQSKTIASMFVDTNSTLSKILAIAFSPSVVYIEPRFSLIAYGQQTLGQYAYVHYNSSDIVQNKIDNVYTGDKQALADYDMSDNITELKDKIYKRPVTADDTVFRSQLSFDVQSVKQEISCGVSLWQNSLWSIIASVSASAIEAIEPFGTASVNSDLKTVEAAAKIGDQAMQQNLLNMGVSNFVTNSLNPSVTTEVTAVKTLDMFFSTSDKQEIYAGPGFVNHNFVAQCIAQSITSTQLEGWQIRTMFLIKAITMYVVNAAKKLTDSAFQTAKEQIGSQPSNGLIGTWVGVCSGVATTATGDLASKASLLVFTAAYLAKLVIDTAADAIASMLDAMGANNFKSYIHARTWRHTFDAEPKHRYGEKSESFMYPCFGCDTAASITDEYAAAESLNKSWKLNMGTSTPKRTVEDVTPDFVTNPIAYDTRDNFSGSMDYYISSIVGKSQSVTLPENMAYVIGAEKFLSDTPFRNKNISVSEPVFPTAPIQDYIIDKRWGLSQTASIGVPVWVSCKDTKLIDAGYSNIVVSDDFCGVASTYAAIEVKQGIDQDYLRPTAITPNVLAINTSGLNCFYTHKAYHAFDGQGYRLISWVGAPGMNMSFQTFQYEFINNDRFKRSNILPANEFLGNFKSAPVTDITTIGDDRLFSQVMQPSNSVGLLAGGIGEDKDAIRYSIPVFTEPVNSLPASIKTLSTSHLLVDMGITNLVTDLRDMAIEYKSPKSVDFTLNKTDYRFTNEYICSIEVKRGISIVKELVPCLGLEFLGTTPYEAYFYSPATRSYYQFTGGTSLQQVNMVERFRDIRSGTYDFINQEVLMNCLATFDRLNLFVHDDKDEVDNIIVPRIKDSRFIGEIQPPTTNIFNNTSWYKTLSLPSGICYQGPNRCVINRSILTEYMFDQIKANYGNWERLPKEVYNPFRTYKSKYEVVNKQIGSDLIIKGWTHNPFLLVTSALGLQSEQDCLFEWEITFCWPVEMDKLYDQDNYATVCIYAETMTPGGKVCTARPTHVYLTKELFTRNNNYGYYSFRYTSKNGIGNRERLYIWSDQYIAISSIQLEYKIATSKRTEQLTQQVDIQNLKEI